MARLGGREEASLFAPGTPQVVGPTREPFVGRDIEEPAKHGHVPIAPTSTAALRARDRGTDRMVVLRLIVTAPRTLDEVAAILNKPANALTGRFDELKKEGLIVKTTSTRKTRSGVSAYIWAATALGIAAINTN